MGCELETRETNKVARKKTEIEISMRTEFGEYCITDIQGRKLYLIVRKAIMDNKKVILHFGCIRLISTFFLEESFGRLIADFDLATVCGTMECKATTAAMKETIEFNLVHFNRYNTDTKYKKDIDKHFKKYKMNSSEVVDEKTVRGSKKTIPVSDPEKLDDKPKRKRKPRSVDNKSA